MKRNTQKYVVIALSAFGTVIILPFAFIRFWRAEWVIGTFDLLVSLVTLSICAYVAKTGKVKAPSLVLAIFVVLAVITSSYLKGVTQVYWAYPATLAAYYLIPLRQAVWLCAGLFAALVPIVYFQADSVKFYSIVATLIMSNVFAYVFSLSVREQHLKLSQMASKDPLTGVGNRRAMEEKLIELVLAQQRSATALSLIMLDLDQFKLINDKHGHIVGDQVLVQLAELLQSRIRRTDALYRYGGEEFVITPLIINLEAAIELAEQLRTLIEESQFPTGEKVTISLGVAQFQPGDSSKGWLGRADKALYRAKAAGRNIVCAQR